MTTTPNISTGRVLQEVLAERARQNEKWGEQNWHDFEGISILTEEVGEAAKAANEANFTSGSTRGDFTHLRAELVQVAAVAVHHIEIIDQRGARPAPALPPAALTRVDTLREIADICDEARAVYASKNLDNHADAAYRLMERFQRKANEAEYVATPCDSMVPCEDGGEPCHVHERLMAHAEGDHELCAPDCGLRAAVGARQ